jgi:dihydroneopterin triphosphate diphosphatase
MTLLYKIPESVLVVIHTMALEVLLLERADQPGFWQSVTGSKESLDELPIETAAREVAEETGIGFVDATGNLCLRDWKLANNYEIYPVWRHRYAPGVTRNIEHVFSLAVSRETVITLAPREHVQFTWLPYQVAAERCFSASNAQAILQLPHRIK